MCIRYVLRQAFNSTSWRWQGTDCYTSRTSNGIKILYTHTTRAAQKVNPARPSGDPWRWYETPEQACACLTNFGLVRRTTMHAFSSGFGLGEKNKDTLSKSQHEWILATLEKNWLVSLHLNNKTPCDLILWVYRLSQFHVEFISQLCSMVARSSYSMPSQERARWFPEWKATVATKKNTRSSQLGWHQ